MENPFSTYLFFKPYNVLSQFSKEHEDHVTLADFIDVEKDVYPVGRLDRDSEGLLLLTNDKSLVNRILHPSAKKQKTYIVQIEGAVDDQALKPLRSGIELRIKKKQFVSQPATVKILDPIPALPERNPPVRFRKTVPTSWVEISITEGKNRQVRKMFAAIDYPVLRLIRTRISEYSLGDLKPGELLKV